MEIDIPDDDIRVLCEQQRLAVRRLGPACARKLRNRLADLQAAAHVHELVAGRPHPLRGDRKGQFALDLHGGVRLVFEPNHNPVPRFADGGIDWAQVTQIIIVYIGDYHD
ncbi:MAG TPA: killer suppression protein HigA [Devosia sp.]|nr:killer suppression protein HigA [Devosia sp.]